MNRQLLNLAAALSLFSVDIIFARLPSERTMAVSLVDGSFVPKMGAPEIFEAYRLSYGTEGSIELLAPYKVGVFLDRQFRPCEIMDPTVKAAAYASEGYVEKWFEAQYEKLDFDPPTKTIALNPHSSGNYALETLIVGKGTPQEKKHYFIVQRFAGDPPQMILLFMRHPLEEGWIDISQLNGSLAEQYSLPKGMTFVRKLGDPERALEKLKSRQQRHYGGAIIAAGLAIIGAIAGVSIWLLKRKKSDPANPPHVPQSREESLRN